MRAPARRQHLGFVGFRVLVGILRIRLPLVSLPIKTPAGISATGVSGTANMPVASVNDALTGRDFPAHASARLGRIGVDAGLFCSDPEL